MLIAGAVLVVILIVGTILAFALATAKKQRAGQDPTTLVRVTRVVAVVWAVVAVIGAAVALLTALLAPGVAITMPIREFWPQLPGTVTLDVDTARRVSGGFTEVTLTVEGLDATTRVLWAVSQAITWVVPGFVALFVAVTCSRLLSGAAFTPVVAKMAVTTGAVIALGGVAAQVMGDIAGSIASMQLFGAKGGGWEGDFPGIDNVFDAWLPSATLQISFPFWPIAIGLAFAVLAAVLRYGSRLQRDTEGLV
ncbi:hypothetical protein [Microbacterium oleivorans]|uniref:Serine/threonine protein kinase n=1 Tax=Microbacterium oleivorans TaxID=273677 RepID=A0A031FXQ7_9MICO|nr:hypothetical protein [Microbacterium oleivorans]EZP28420.1 Serine/threonine protein kinase [Microbacterium oleivorans]